MWPYNKQCNKLCAYSVHTLQLNGVAATQLSPTGGNGGGGSIAASRFQVCVCPDGMRTYLPCNRLFPNPTCLASVM